MVEHSAFLIACVDHSFGGAAKTLEYATRTDHIKIFNIGTYKV